MENDEENRNEYCQTSPKGRKIIWFHGPTGGKGIFCVGLGGFKKRLDKRHTRGGRPY